MQSNYIKSGTGSGGLVNVEYVVSIPEGLRRAGLNINEELVQVYADWEKEHPFDKGNGWATEPWSQVEMPVSDEIVKKASANSDSAIVIIGRTAGEDKDNSNVEGSYLLTTVEKDMLAKVTKHFESSWINQDFLDLDKRHTAIEKSTTKVEAEASEFYHLVKVQDGDKNEEASNGKMLGSAQVLRAKSIGLTLENFTADQIRMVPYFSYTVNAPMDGYYSVSMNFCGDGRLAKNQIGMLVDDEISAVKYNRTGKISEKNRAIMTVYLTKGEHNLTFTSPLPMNVAELKDTDWSQRWMNFDYITLHDGLKLAAKQKSPTNIDDLVRIEAEDVGLPNMTKVSAAAEGQEAKEGYVGGARYRRSQSVAAIKADGIDARRTPFVQYTVNAKSAGTYTAYFQASYGIYKPTVEKMTGTVAIEVNGKVTFHEVELVKNKTNNILIPVKMDLSAGNNTVRLTHLTADSIKGEGYGWMDFNYIEVSASDSKKITFVPTNGVVEAERSEAVTYVENSSSGSSGGACLGKGDYNYIDAKDVTFENLDVKKLGELSRVTYTVVAEQAGTYNIAIQFNGGVTRYTFNRDESCKFHRYVVYVIRGQSL